MAATMGPGAAHDSGVSDTWIDFDIPAQPLSTALNVYGSTTHIQLFVDSALTSGRRSAALRGLFTPEGGLFGLIAGTGLTARPIGDVGFTLVPLQTPQTGEGTDLRQLRLSLSSSAALQFGSYSARLQRALIGVLCRRPDTQPGTFRALVQLWIDSSGAVTRAALLTSTGDRGRDAALLETLGSWATGAVPPEGLPQPISLLLAPGARTAESYCRSSSPTLDRADVTP